ncbi:PadR family transcriptional regulator [Streptomyces sp. NPDC053542]|uniref:PadR family transcriptional regulator n=1 Tax=Streptomyces sp. NPDC053542 TaxID=3365710 RepID=UPI0037CD94D2
MADDDTSGAEAGAAGGGRGADLPATGWAVLGLLSFGTELSGYDLKKWADWSLGFFYWSPSFSQIYGELKRLEKAGYAASRLVTPENGGRGKRVYRITEAGTAAVRTWTREAPVEPPVLKHGVMLRLWLGHLTDPARMRDVLATHQDYAEAMRRRAAADAEGAATEDAWAYTELTLKWAERYYAAERDRATEMMAELAELEDRREPGRADGS